MKRGVVWITGSGGLIGSYLVRSAPRFASAWTVRPLDRAMLDLTDAAAVRQLFAREQPSAVIHCAALSKTPACEAAPELARRVNVDATALLAQLAASIPLLFFSTDLVFDGRQGHYDEAATPHPLNGYAQTKVEAERLVLANPRHTVIRTSLNGGVSPTGDRGFNEEWRRLAMAGRPLQLFTDEFRSPLPAAVTARAVWELLDREEPGLYHIAGRERLSRWEIGRLLADRWHGIKVDLQPGSLRDYTGPTRSPDTSLDCAKAQRLLSFPLPAFSEWLKENPGEPM